MITPPPSAPTDSGEALPTRTTPTWEMEILLSGATVFALFQVYAALNEGVFWLLQRLPLERIDILSPLGMYVQAGVLALALGFLAHLVLRSVWVAMVGLRSVDPGGQLRRNENLGPEQRSLVAEAWDALPQRIAALDDIATLVFGFALSLARMMALLALFVAAQVGLAFASTSLLGVPDLVEAVFFSMLAALMLPLMLATMVDNRAGRAGRAAPGWVAPLLRVYRGLGLTADGNLGLTMATYRLAGSKRSWRGQFLIGLTIAAIILAVMVGPLLQNRGISGLLDGDFPTLRAADAEVLRGAHYLDRVRPRDAQRLPALPTEQVRGPYAVLWIPYVPEWHDAPLRACTAALPGGRWRSDPAASRGVLECVARAQPLRLNGLPLAAPWWWSEDPRRDRRGFQIMIDVRALPPGPQLLEVGQPEAARAPDDEQSDAPWRIPFWT